MIIRQIKPKERSVLKEFLYHAIFIPPGAALLPHEIIYQPDIYIYIDGFGGKDDCGVVAEEDGKVVGAAWTRIIPAFGYVDGETPELCISLLSEYRGQGIGTMLLTRLFELLCDRGYRQTSLAVQKENAAALLYQRMGYVIVRENDEDYIMVKKLCTERDFPICLLYSANIIPAMDLVWRVFREFEAPDYSDEGVAEFQSFIEPSAVTANMGSGKMKLWGAFDGDKIIGVIAASALPRIHLLFVDKQYHRLGIAKKLLRAAQNDSIIAENPKQLTVNSSPYAVKIYRRLGFVSTGPERTVNGLRFTPMEYEIYRG